MRGFQNRAREQDWARLEDGLGGNAGDYVGGNQGTAVLTEIVTIVMSSGTPRGRVSCAARIGPGRPRPHLLRKPDNAGKVASPITIRLVTAAWHRRSSVIPMMKEFLEGVVSAALTLRILSQELVPQIVAPDELLKSHNLPYILAIQPSNSP
jgi:hypothetical protein